MTDEQEARCLALQVAGSLHDPAAVLTAADAYTRFLLTGAIVPADTPEPEAPPAPMPEPLVAELGWTFKP